MNPQTIGAWLVMGILWVDMGRIQDMIPILKYTKPGFLIQLGLFVLVLANLSRLRFNQPLIVWRFLFLLSVVPGLFVGYGTGRVRMVFETEVQRFLSGFLGMVLFIRGLADLKRMHSAIVYLAFLLSLWTLTHGGCGPGLLRDENDIAMFLVMLLPFSYMKSTLETNALRKGFCMLVFLLTLAGIASTISRGGMVGALPTLGFIWLKSKRKILSLVLLAISLALTVAFGPEKLISEFKTIGDTNEGTASSRLYFWGLSWEMMKLRPLFGVGAMCWGNGVWGMVQSGELVIPSRIGNMTPHSVYFQLISEVGILGTVAWVGLLGVVAKALYSIRESALNRQMGAVLGRMTNPAAIHHAMEMQSHVKAASVSLAICILGFLLASAFLSVLFYPQLYFFVALIQATKNIWERELVILQATAGGGKGGQPQPSAGPPQPASGASQALPAGGP